MLATFGSIGRFFVRLLVRIYYARIEISGRELLPRSGALLVAANHANSLIDPVLLGIAVKRPVHFLAKAPMFATPILGDVMRSLGMIPAFRAVDDPRQTRRNLESFKAATEYLLRGEAVGIFPEGKSHDELRVERLHSGAARIAVEAIQAGTRDLLLVPIGINFERKEQFRSAIWIRVGAPISVDRLVQEHEGEPRKASRHLTEEVQQRLQELAIHLNDPVWEPYLRDLEVLLPAERASGCPAINALRRRKQLADAMNFFLVAHPVEAQELAVAVASYRERVNSAGLAISSPIMRLRRGRLFFRLLSEAAWLFFWSLPALLGTVHHLLPFAIVRGIAPKVQAPGRSTVALARLGLSLPIYAVWYAIVWLALRSYFLPWVAWVWTASMPFAGMFALTYWRRLRDGCRAWGRQFSLFFHSAQLRDLRGQQLEVKGHLEKAAKIYLREHPSETPPAPGARPFIKTAVRWALITAAAVAVLVWQISWRRSGETNPPGLNLKGMPAASIRVNLDSDEKTLHDVLAGLNNLEERCTKIRGEFAEGKRDWYRQADNDAVRQLLLAYLNYRTALLRIIWKYQNNGDVDDAGLRLRAFLTGFTAASALFDTSLKFVTLFEQHPSAVRKLNEPEPLWNIPAGVYDSIRHSVQNREHWKLIRAAQRQYAEMQSGFAKHQLKESFPYADFHAAVNRASQSILELSTRLSPDLLPGPLADTHKAGQDMVYRTKTFISTWIGDTKIREPRRGRGLIGAGQVKEARSRLQPGDILLERRNWYLSNAFLPGYWPHSALYIGSASDLEQAGLRSDPRVQKHWQRFCRPDAKGHEHAIIESISEGVVFTSLEHSVGEADSVAFLRPNLPPAAIREAIGRAFAHLGKPYDFEFDFFTTDKLVCTELVYRCYDGEIRFPLVEILGTKTMPAIEIVRTCVLEKQSAKPQFKFIAFLDGSENSGTAAFKDEAEFLKTVDRPALTWLQGLRSP